MGFGRSWPPNVGRERKFTWLVGPRSVGKLQFFETRGWFAIPQRNQATGNSVKRGDGRATVMGYKLPWPLIGIESIGKAEARFEAQSQDTGLFALVPILPHRRVNFSAKEKDEASPPDCFRRNSRKPSFPLCRSLEAFAFQDATSIRQTFFKLRAGLAAQ